LMGSSGLGDVDELLRRVLPESRKLVAQLWSDPLLPATALRDQVDSYVEVFRAAQRGNEFLDVRQAESLGEQCRRLLDAVGDDAPEERRRLVQIAVRYFVIEDDGDDDMGIGGLDDDEAVVAAVEELLSADTTD